MPAALSSSLGLSPLPRPKESFYLAATAPRPKVWGSDGEALGTIRHLVVEKASGRIACALLACEGPNPWQKRRAIPWTALTYDARLRAYRAEITRDLFRTAPALRRRERGDMDLFMWKVGMFYGYGG